MSMLLGVEVFASALLIRGGKARIGQIVSTMLAGDLIMSGVTLVESCDEGASRGANRVPQAGYRLLNRPF